MSTSAQAARRWPSRRSAAMGFTMVELVVVVMLVGVLAAVAVPKMAAVMGARDDAWRDGLLDALRYAQKSAVSHRRLVCATVSNTQVTLQIATTNPASLCDASLTGPSASNVFASSGTSAMTTTVSASGVIYFQPDGRATSDGAGNTTADRTVTPSGQSPISIIGETGHAE